MPEHNGIFVVLEGADGSGKGTQFKLLTERLRAVGYEVEVFDFPRYHKTASHFVRRYLNGDYGPAKNISPYTASLFYALDRYEAAPAIRKALAAGKIVLANRYVGSNMAHQGGKFSNPIEQRGFFVWEDGLEFQMLGIPRPNFNFFLRVPAEISYKLIAQKAKREYTSATHDEHEKDMDHLRNSISTYDTLCQLFPRDFQAIECTKNGKMLSIAEINDKIWGILRPMLPQKPHYAARDLIVNLENKSEEQEGEPPALESLPPKAPGSDPNYISLNINKISLLAVHQIQAVQDIETELRSLYWPNKEEFAYYTPAEFPNKLSIVYKEALQKQIKLYQQMLKSGSKNPDLALAIQGSVPLAALASIKISGSKDALQNLMLSLKANPLAEVRWLSEQLIAAAHKLHPQQFKSFTEDSTSISLQRDAPKDVIAQLVAEHLPQGLSANTEDVTLLEAHPRNEFHLLADSLYSYSTATRSDLGSEIENWSYEEKVQALKAAANQPTTNILKEAEYLWNIICDKTTFDKLQVCLKMNNIRMQPPTPRYGYEVSEIIEELGLDEIFMDCFDESLKLFSSLQAGSHDELSAYGTLLGHKNRWQFKTTAQDLKNAKLTDNSAYTKLISLMHQKISEVHPILSEFIENQPQAARLPSTKKNSPHPRRRARKPKK